MKGQSKRFVSHKGKAYDMGMKKKDENIGFLDLWRYGTLTEKITTFISVVVGFLCSGGMIAAVLIYGELSALFIQRHNTAPPPPNVYILSWFGGGRTIEEKNRTVHMDALVDDSVSFALASVAIMFYQLITAAAAVTLANWAACKMITRIRWKLLRSVLSQETAFFDTNTTMNFATSLTEDTEKLKLGVGEHVAMASYLAGCVVLASTVALANGWQLALTGLAIIPLALISAATIAKYQTRCSGDEVVAYGAAGRIVEQALAAIRTVRAYAGEEQEVSRYKEALVGASSAAKRRCTWAGGGVALGWFFTYTLNAVIFTYGAALCVRDMGKPVEETEYHPGVMITVLFCAFMAAQNVAMFNPHLEIFSTARGAARSLFRILERQSKINALENTGATPESFKGNIIFENLYFNYPSRPDVKVLRGLSLKINAGETVALVGGSGCGKSTLLQLLQRAYEPDSGNITVDGHHLNSLHLHHFRSSIGVVGQEPVLFSGTIRENIMLGVENATEEDMIEAAKTAHAHLFVSKLANGYDTVLGEKGAQLSGGQKQRIAIARALLRKPAILLLDEPTSALDPAAERQVQAALDAASKGRTTLVVSHRLSTIVNASRIVYMEQGSVLEQGTHLQLLELKGAYWKLVQEDMTHKSINATVSETAEDEFVEVEVEKKDNHLKRSSSIMSTHSQHFKRDTFARVSSRLGSITPRHIMPDIPQQDENTEPETEEDVSSWELLKLNSKEWPLLLGGGVASFIIGATMPCFAFLFSKLYGMFSWPDHEEILHYSQIYGGLFALTAAISGVVTFLQAWLFGIAGCRLTDRLRIRTFSTYLVQEQGWFDVPINSVGALCARLASDCAAVQGATGTRLGTMLQGVSTMVLGIGLAMFFSWKMTIVSLLSIPCVIGGITLEGFVTKRTEKRERQALESASRMATEAVINVRTVHSLSVETAILDRYSAALSRAAREARGALCVRGPVYGLCLCAPTFGYAVSLSYGGYLIAREDFKYEYVMLVSEALVYGAWMLAEALSFAPSFAAARRSGARILQMLQREPKVQSHDTAQEDNTWVATGKIIFDNIHFHYPTRPQVPVLRGVNLELPAGKTLALVGPSGCGKSTLMHLLMRSYDPDNGVVTLDDKDIVRDLTLPQLRKQLGLVQQEPVMFERSIKDNIAYGDNSRDVPLEEIVAVAKQANVHNFVASLPLGYDTVLEAGSAALSGGQKQRVAIARALLRNPRVLLLDEATSALDASSEKAVQAALEAASKDRTTVIIAHRLATVRHADTICVIDKGAVAESGSHDELVRRRGLYWELLQQQAPA